jgi:hypothetical protein
MMEGLSIFVGLFAILALSGWVWWRASNRLLKKFNGEFHFSVATYVVGLPGCDRAIERMECVVTPTDFVFARMNGQEMGRIPRNQISEVLVDDKSQLTQRLTAMRIAVLGPFAFAVPKASKISEWCVAVRWADSTGLPRATLFEFTGPNCMGNANRAANYMMSYVRKQVKVDDNRACPYCAEMIKAAARICRYCNREI